MLNHGVNAGRHPHKDRGADLYETPPEAVHALLDVVTLPPCIWECACGRGAISEVLREAGREVLSTDLNDYGYGEPRVDFLLERHNPAIDSTRWAICTNPPFKLADQFVRHALTLCPTVIMLLWLAFLESVGRTDILDGGESTTGCTVMDGMTSLEPRRVINRRVNKRTLVCRADLK
jgi:hypothetical protein